MAEHFDPIAALQALERRHVSFVLVGGLGRVIQGSDELTDGLDFVPSLKDDNLARLALALDDLNARRADGKRLALERDLGGRPVLELESDAGELKLIAEPAGTRGYSDLRRGASREPLGHGVRPQVASLGDQARMLAALNLDQDLEALHTLRRLIELEHERSRGLSIER